VAFWFDAAGIRMSRLPSETQRILQRAGRRDGG
jgi:hypothetical protein